MLRSRKPEEREEEEVKEKEDVATPQPWTDEMQSQVYTLMIGYSIAALAITGAVVYGAILVYNDMTR